MKTSTIRVVVETTLPPESVLEAAYDFSERRPDVWPNVSLEPMEVHELGGTSADVTEGTRAGPIVNWERCRYDWSKPGSVTATVIDTNIYAIPGSSWELRATPEGNGSRVEMIWVREFRRGPRGRIFGTAFRLFGNRIFNKYGRDILANLEKVDAARSSAPQSD